MFFVIVFIQLSYSQQSDNAIITGTILNPDNETIKIGDDVIDIPDSGEFIFTTQIKNPSFFEVSYGNLYWLIYLEPNKTVKFAIQSPDLSNLTYEGVLKVPNEFLKKTSLINTETNDFFNTNWVRIHSMNETKFISVIDSLKQLFFKPLVSIQNKDISNDFVKLFQWDVNYGFNSLIVQYPKKHYDYIHEKVTLSNKGIDYLNSGSIDNVKLMGLQSYKRYCRAWINYNTDILADRIIEKKQYDLKKMDVIFDYIPTLFKNQVLIDYWLSEYLNGFTKKVGLANSETYFKAFSTICKTEVYKNKTDKLYNSYLDAEKDHLVKVYKSVNGYLLEAHIFYPDEVKEGKKRPAIAVFHGGGWVSGSASWVFGRAKHFAQKGMVGIAVQYRLSNFVDITPVEAMEDSRDVMIWLRTHADTLGINPDNIAGEGWSAGGQLVLSAAFFADTVSNRKINSAPNALILKSPALRADNWFITILGKRDIDPKTLSPLDNIIEGISLPPTLILQGRTDGVTPTKYAQLFHDRMQAAHYQCELVIYENCGHLFTPSYLDDTGWPNPDKEISKKADKKADDFLIKLGYIVE